MEILFITHKYPPSVGGMEKQSYELTRGMERHARVHLLCCDGSESKIRFFARLKRRIRAKIQQHPGISVLHFNDGLAAAFCAGPEDFPGLIRSVTLHGLDVVFPNAIFQSRILPRLKNFQSLIAVSQATADACIARGLSPEKITVIPNGVDHGIAHFQPSTTEQKDFQEKYGPVLEGGKILLMMGRPVLRKGFSWFLKTILPALPADHRVLIIGPFREKRPLSDKLLSLLPTSFKKQLELMFGMPSDENTLRALLQQPEIKNRVRHLGRLPFNEVMQVMSAAHVFIMPNIPVEGDMEGFGLVCLEANLRGLPVVASHLEGITAAIQNGKNGWLVPSQDREAWLKALAPLQENPVSIRVFGAQARQYVIEHFSWETMVEAYYHHFNKLTIRH